MQDLKKSFVWVVIAGIIIIFVIIMYNNVKDLQQQEEKSIISKAEYNKEKVISPSEFFTVANCINSYTTYIMENDKEKIYAVLDQEYINKHHITKDNVLQFVPSISLEYSPSCRKMYRKRINNHVVSYYVHFEIEENVLEGLGNKKDLYAIVYLVENKMMYSIEPYEGEVFKSE